jgi:hypothetical protein
MNGGGTQERGQTQWTLGGLIGGGGGSTVCTAGVVRALKGSSAILAARAMSAFDIISCVKVRATMMLSCRVPLKVLGEGAGVEVRVQGLGFRD